MSRITTISVSLLLSALGTSIVHGQDWPTYRHDNRRGGVALKAPQLPLTPLWQRRANVPPLPAWTGPAPWDAFAANDGLQPQRDFDLVYYTTVADGMLYCGSSVDDAVHCIEASSGREQWAFFTGGAVRLPPTIHEGRAYFGSDDGHAYCVDAANGKLVWKVRGGPAGKLIPSNGKLISLWPCRTGVLIEGGKAYCAFSLAPWKESFLCALNASDGQLEYRKSSVGDVYQGPMAAHGTLIVMQGKAPPLAFNLSDGSGAGSYSAASGVRCAITEDGLMILGPKNQKNRDDVVQVIDQKTRRTLTAFNGSDRLLIDGRFGYLHLGEHLIAIDRVEHIELSMRWKELSQRKSTLSKKKGPEKDVQAIEAVEEEIKTVVEAMGRTVRWRLAAEAPHEIIKAGGVLFLGSKNEVAAVDAESGKALWAAKVDGRAHGLTVADGRLFVSTDLGHIYAFGPADDVKR